MTQDQAEKFAEDFNEGFCSPFMPEGFIKCEAWKNPENGRLSLIFDIGDRNVAFDADDPELTWYGQDTRFPNKWSVERLTQDVPERYARAGQPA